MCAEPCIITIQQGGKKETHDVDCPTRGRAPLAFRQSQVLLPFATIPCHVPLLVAKENFFLRCRTLPFALAFGWMSRFGKTLRLPSLSPLLPGVGGELMYCCVRAMSRISRRVLIQVCNRAVFRIRCPLTRESCIPKMTTPICAFRDCTS